MLSYKI